MSRWVYVISCISVLGIVSVGFGIYSAALEPEEPNTMLTTAPTQTQLPGPTASVTSESNKPNVRKRRSRPHAPKRTLPPRPSLKPIEPLSKTSRFQCRDNHTSCINNVLVACQHRGHPGCHWKNAEAKKCLYSYVITGAAPMRKVLHKKTLLFLGDSMLRDVFNAVLWQCCIGTLPKKLANMRKRTPHLFRYVKNDYDITLVFRFDFDPEQLLTFISEFPVAPDGILVSVGSHPAFNTTRWNVLESQGGVEQVMQTFMELTSKKYGEHVPVVFLAQHIECDSMASTRIGAFREKAAQCPEALAYLRQIQQNMLAFSEYMRKYGYPLWYVPALECESGCTEDGMHSKGGKYSRARVDLVLNVFRKLW
eukprot:PhF_6_TR21682/c0_g1_i1/m.30950